MIRSATPADVPAIARLIRALAEYEKLSHEVVLSEENLSQHLFGPRPYAEVVLAEAGGQVVGFALFFHNYSTFLAKPGLYLEDLFVYPQYRGRGLGRRLLQHLARVAVEREAERDPPAPRQRTPDEEQVRVERLMSIARAAQALPIISDMTDDEILGYDEHGIPSR